MEKYPTYKQSGIKWISEIPEHWETLRAKNMFTKEKRSIREEDDVITCFRDGQVTLRKNRRTTGFTESITEVGYQGIRKGDLVIHQMDAFAGAIGVSDSDGKGTSVYHCCTPKGKYDATYFAYLIRIMAYSGYIQSLYRGIRERSSDFNFNIFGRQYLAVPPYFEQQSIVTFLENETANIDAYIKQRQQEIIALNELKQAEIAQVVTKGLNPNAPMKDSGIAWIGEIPEHWECKRIGSTYIENKHINSDLGCNEAYKFNYGSLVRKDEDVKLEEVADVYSKYTVISKNDIIINGLNLNYDFVTQRVAIVEQKGIITSAYVAITPRDEVNSEYFSYLFKSMDAKKLFNGMGTGIRLTLGFGELKKQQIPIPPKDEQDLIVKNIKAKTSKIEEYIAALKSEIAQMQEYKQRLISDVVTGKMKV
jgi:Restriction endonuclease S subunits